ncbi:MAG: isoleucine--tRNA ligase [Aquificae bacterium]|nr:isoleucine--tRNA ligase [Aquificota bacterium]
METSKDFKETLNLPRTDFPMKANLPKREPQILKKWEGLYEKVTSMRKGKETFVLHDGPPYANGHIHVGHALNKILKDVINKYNLMTGKNINFIPGWDCHGLPIERAVEKELSKKKIKKEDIPKTEFRRLCREYALKYVNIQREEFKRLGVLADWERPYLTMDPSYEATEIRELGRFFQKNLVYRSKKPVYWCIYDKTAEAEAEVEYKEKQDPSVYVKFPLKEPLFKRQAHLLIWTTTPWTLPANLGVMINPDAEYVLWKEGEELLIFANERLKDLVKDLALKGEVFKTIKGEELLGLSYEHPFVKREELKGYLSEETLWNMWKVYPSEFVTLDTGTGLVHMAPGHGQEDYIVGKRYGLEPYAPVSDDGRFTKPAPGFLIGLRVFDANEVIIQTLKEKGYLLFEGKIVHSYPHCWRCKNPVIFRATPQWFIGMDLPLEGQKTLRQKALEEIEKVKWIPQYGKNRIKSMVENRPDWCISRQRFWGVPITVFYCKRCGQVASEPEIFEKVASVVEKSEGGTDVWFSLPPEELLPEGYRCKNCGSTEFEKEEDILDVWFDSGCSHAAVIRPLGFEKADMYLEGSDQHRGWFQASLLESVGSYGSAPYRSVLTHGFIVDEKGRKMSKSLGNVISPQEIIDELGADILRLWVVSEDYTEDVALGKNLLRKISEDYRKLRNTFRYLLANLYDFDPGKALPFEELHHFDKWALSRLQEVLSRVHEYYNSYLFYRVHNTLKNFVITELSAVYLDVLKDRLYTYAPSSKERLSAQTALWHLLLALTTSTAPYLSFTAEEVWEHVRKIDPSLPESVFMYEIPKPNPKLRDEEVLKDYETLMKVRQEVMRALEFARKEKGLIKHPYEAHVYVSAKGEIEKLLKKYEDYMKFFFTVSAFTPKEGGEIELEGEELPLKVGVSRAEGRKCPRCWMYYPEEEFEGEVCPRCANALREMGISLGEA